MPLRKVDLLASFRKANRKLKVDKNLEIEKYINSKTYSFAFWLKPNRNYLELRFVRNKTANYTSDISKHTISRLDLVELTENMNQVKKIAKENNIEYIVMDTWIFDKKDNNLLSLFCKKFNLELYNTKEQRTEKYMNWLLFHGKLRKMLLKEYPRYVFKIKD